ncbi:AzlD domain-containing protein [Pusillimonas sp. ANT_WB101]|uniref:AzlD domain-containing protein n=1 Tax=Pusillimonas sp. ANT_WB101 TaxID=2597356 RepID=UPI0011ED98A7|nr:AzlD domain-containing protein [Pusillimonas sp. ANT_WB101]KAA0890052.1 AzlD domain-containing protein [Pusillimonas sp. ANT_WB101]
MMGASDYDLYVLGAIGVLTLCSVITRTVYFLFGDRVTLSDGVRRALRYAPTAALIGIVVPEIMPWQAGVGPEFDIRLLAAVVAVLVFLRTRSTVLVIVSGMVALWVLQMVVGLF